MEYIYLCPICDACLSSWWQKILSSIFKPLVMLLKCCGVLCKMPTILLSIMLLFSLLLPPPHTHTHGLPWIFNNIWEHCRTKLISHIDTIVMHWKESPLCLYSTEVLHQFSAIALPFECFKETLKEVLQGAEKGGWKSSTIWNVHSTLETAYCRRKITV